MPTFEIIATCPHIEQRGRVWYLNGVPTPMRDIQFVLAQLED